MQGEESKMQSVNVWFTHGLVIGILALTVSHVRVADAGETWDGGHGSADEACRARLDESGAFKFSRAKLEGNVAHCFTKAKDGKGEEFDDAAVTKDEPAPEDRAAQEPTSSSTEAPASQPATGESRAGSSCAGQKIKDKKVGYWTNDFQSELNAIYAKSPTEAGGLNAGWVKGRNVAVLELKNGQRLAFTSGSQLHSEQHILNYLNEQNIRPDGVSRIYTELSPCLDQCLPPLIQWFKGYEKCVVIEYSWVHTDKESMRWALQAQRRQQAMGK